MKDEIQDQASKLKSITQEFFVHLNHGFDNFLSKFLSNLD